MTDNDTQPGGASPEFNATPLSDAISAGDDRHERHQEVGEAEVGEASTPPAAAAPAAPAPAAQPGPKAATPPNPAPAGQAGDPPAEPAGDPRAPKWYRDDMARRRREEASNRAEMARLRAENERFRGQAPRPQGGPQPQILPDPIEDPEGYDRHINDRFETRLSQFELRSTLRISERFARQQHGNEAFDEVQAWLTTKPELADWCVNQDDPWAAAFSQYNRERLAEEIGDDPNAWREAEKARIRAEIEAEMAGGGRTPQPPARATMTPSRAAPPPAASSARSAGNMDRDAGGRFAGPTPLSSVLGKRR